MQYPEVIAIVRVALTTALSSTPPIHSLSALRDATLSIIDQKISKTLKIVSESWMRTPSRVSYAAGHPVHQDPTVAQSVREESRESVEAWNVPEESPSPERSRSRSNTGRRKSGLVKSSLTVSVNKLERKEVNGEGDAEIVSDDDEDWWVSSNSGNGIGNVDGIGTSSPMVVDDDSP